VPAAGALAVLTGLVKLDGPTVAAAAALTMSGCGLVLAVSRTAQVLIGAQVVPLWSRSAARSSSGSPHAVRTISGSMRSPRPPFRCSPMRHRRGTMQKGSDKMVLDDRIKELLDGRAFAVLATLNPDGTPQTSVIWVARDGDALVFTTHDGRQKARNLRHDPRVSMTVFDPDDPYRTADIRGTVELIDDPDRSLSFTLTRRYLGQDPPPDPPGSHRLIGRLTPTRVTPAPA
jgi:PPOX class probable F420-dependent enzyme